MAAMNGHLYLSERQLNLILKGRDVKIKREGKPVVLGLKRGAKARKMESLANRIEKLQERLDKLK